MMSMTVRPQRALVAALAIFAVVAVASILSPVQVLARHAAGEPQRSTADGVYTDAQRTRGQSIYAAQCADCHSADLTGGDNGPSLAGYEFTEAWKSETAGDLFEKIRTEPPTSPGKLSPQESAEVLAYILSKNRFPAGQTELAADLATLKSIKFGKAAAAGPEPNRSVLDGVYLEAQISRGQGIYTNACAQCHAAALTGGDVIPPLVGPDFLGKWTGATAGELFELIRTTMPQTSPGSLAPQQYADVLALILNKNKFPAGSMPLDPDSAALRMIRIETSKKR